jgi:putative ABC transport system ATP-binding protein
MAEPLIRTRGLGRVYEVGDNRIRALDGVSIDVAPGESVAVMGPSGSGKSTFMNLIGCLDRPSAGEYQLAGQTVSTLAADELAGVRNRRIGFVFQSFNLLSRTTALENVEMPLLYQGVSGAERHRRANAALEKVGLAGREDHHPNQLSGGQQQRVAIARALVTDAPIIMADEPTGNLDTRTSYEVMAILQGLVGQGKTIILVTHEGDIAAYASRVVTLRDGLIIDDKQQTPVSATAALAAVPAPAHAPAAGASP